MFTGTSDPQIRHYPPAKWSSNVEQAPDCPRCASSNTKFCYYNNYSFSQPRYFCKGCRRYWTKGGSLRNVPVGGGCRKSRRVRSARPSLNSRPDTASASRCTMSVGESGGDRSERVAEIDLAAVFARFVNQSSGAEDKVFDGMSERGSSSSFGGNCCSNSSDSETQLKHGDLIQDQAQLMEEIPCFREDYTFDQLQNLLIGDQLSQENLWFHGANPTNFGFEMPEQLPEIGPFSSDEQSKISSNLINENWGLFDLSGYGIFQDSGPLS